MCTYFNAIFNYQFIQVKEAYAAVEYFGQKIRSLFPRRTSLRTESEQPAYSPLFSALSPYNNVVQSPNHVGLMTQAIQGSSPSAPFLYPLGQGLLRSQITHESATLNQDSQSIQGLAHIAMPNAFVQGSQYGNVQLGFLSQNPTTSKKLSNIESFDDTLGSLYQPQFSDQGEVTLTQEIPGSSISLPVNEVPGTLQQHQVFAPQESFESQNLYGSFVGQQLPTAQQIQFVPYSSPMFIQAIPQGGSHGRIELNSNPYQASNIPFLSPLSNAAQQFTQVPKFYVQAQQNQAPHWAHRHVFESPSQYEPGLAGSAPNVLPDSNQPVYLNPYIGPQEIPYQIRIAPQIGQHQTEESEPGIHIQVNPTSQHRQHRVQYQDHQFLIPIDH